MSNRPSTNVTFPRGDGSATPDIRAPWYPRVIRRVFSTLLFRFRVRPRIESADTVVLDGLTLRIPPTVFHPGFYYTSRFLARYVARMDLSGRHVLDMGCGSGFVSLVAASRGARVTAVDINESAVASTRNNAERNGFDVKAHRSDLFDQLHGERFDIILINPPFYEGEPLHVAEHAWKGGDQLRFVRRFASQAGMFLVKGGSVLAVLSTEAKLQQVLRCFEESGFTAHCLSSKRKLFETLFLFEFTPRVSG